MALEDFFLVIGMVILIGFMGSLIRQRIKVPESLFLILFGLLIGPVTGLIPGQALLEFVPIVSIAAMIVILVEAGIEFDLFGIRATFGKATLLTLSITALTTIFVALLLTTFYGWEPAHAVLLGIICSGTTTITAMSLLRTVSVGNEVRKLILLETIINDFTLILGTLIVVEFIKFASFAVENAVRLVLSELSVGIVVGMIFAFIWRYVLEDLNLTRELNYASTIGVCFVLYYAASFFGGNSIIAIFSFSLLLANYYKIYDFIKSKKEIPKDTDFDSVLHSIRNVQTDFTFFMKSFFFVLLGVTFDLSVLGRISPFLIGGIVLLILLARFLASSLLSKIDKGISQHRMLISIMIPRGYVAAVLAFVPGQLGINIPFLTDIVVILIVVTTIIAIIGTTLYARNMGKKRK